MLAPSAKIAVAAVRIAARPQHSIAVAKDGRWAIAVATSNMKCRIILHGGEVTNHAAVNLEPACAMIAKAWLPARVMLDTSHADCGKQPENQHRVIADIAGQIEAGEERTIAVMTESHPIAERQDLRTSARPIHGQSITATRCKSAESGVGGTSSSRIGDACCRRPEATAVLFASTRQELTASGRFARRRPIICWQRRAREAGRFSARADKPRTCSR